MKKLDKNKKYCFAYNCAEIVLDCENCKYNRYPN